MKKIRSNFFLMAIVAIFASSIVSCSKDSNNNGGGGENADFTGTYYGSYSIATVLEVEDTLVVTNSGENKLSVYSSQLDTAFTATQNGNKATFQGFSASSFTTGSLTLTGIDVQGGNGTLTDGTKLNVNLNGVSVEGYSGNVPAALAGLFPLHGIDIKTKKTFIKQ